MEIKVSIKQCKHWYDEDDYVDGDDWKDVIIDIEDSDILKLGDRYKELSKKRTILDE